MKLLSRMICLALLMFGCGNDNDNDSDLNTVKACEDYASAVAKASIRCEDVYDDVDAAYQSLIDYMFDGSCSNVLAVRDSKTFYDGCIPSLDTIACDAFLKGDDWDATCKKQLIMPNEE